MYYPDDDPVGIPQMIYLQTSYDSAALTKAGVIQGLTIDDDQRKTGKNSVD